MGAYWGCCRGCGAHLIWVTTIDAFCLKKSLIARGKLNYFTVLHIRNTFGSKNALLGTFRARKLSKSTVAPLFESPSFGKIFFPDTLTAALLIERDVMSASNLSRLLSPRHFSFAVRTTAMGLSNEQAVCQQEFPTMIQAALFGQDVGDALRPLLDISFVNYTAPGRKTDVGIHLSFRESETVLQCACPKSCCHFCVSRWRHHVEWFSNLICTSARPRSSRRS